MTGPFDWMAQAACAGMDPDLFFPERGESVKEAKEKCQTCPVREECLTYAIENGEDFGIWGGMSTQERTIFRRYGVRTSVRTCPQCRASFQPQDAHQRYCGLNCRRETKNLRLRRGRAS